MIWTDRIRQVKIFLVIAAVFIAVASLVVSHFLVRDLAEEERNRMAVWAEAMRTLNNADENTDLNLVLKVINENNSIPVIVMDSETMLRLFVMLMWKGKIMQIPLLMLLPSVSGSRNKARILKLN